MNRRPRRDLAILAAGALLALALVIVGLTSGARRLEHSAPVRTQAPVVVGGGKRRSVAPNVGAAERSAARRTALAFVRSYLPVLYGQASPETIASATAHLRRSLRDAPRPSRAVRQRHPRLQALALTVQTSRSMVAMATISDDVAPPFGVIFTIERRGGGWIVSDLASD